MEKKQLRFWRFVANLDGEFQAVLRWSYLTSLPPRRSVEDKSTPFRVDLKATDGRILATWPALALRVQDGSGRAVLSGSVPWHPDTALIEVRRTDVLLFEVRVPARPPLVELGKLEPKLGGPQVLRWDSTAAEGALLRSSVFIELDNGKRYPLANHIEEKEIEINLDALPGCAHGRIIVCATDGVWTTEAASDRLELPPKAPLAWIAFPRTGQMVRSDQPLQLRGHGWDIQGQRPAEADALEWILDGRVIGKGMLLVVDVLPGKHSLVLRVHGREGLVNSVETTFSAAPRQSGGGTEQLK
jgi:hypothetical protein